MADIVDKGEIREEGGRARLTIDAPRPLAKAADELESSYGWHINYEDPVYNRPADLVDASDPADLRLGAPRLLGPKGGKIEIEYAVPDPRTGTSPPEEVLKALIAEHHRRGNPGVFKVVRGAGDAFDIVPVKASTGNGQPSLNAPLLDTLVSFPETEQAAELTVRAICQSLTERTGFRVGVGMCPLNILMSQNVRIGASEEPARSVLARTLDATGWKLAWWVFYDPASEQYFLNIHIVSVRITTRRGTTVLRPVQAPYMKR